MANVSNQEETFQARLLKPFNESLDLFSKNSKNILFALLVTGVISIFLATIAFVLSFSLGIVNVLVIVLLPGTRGFVLTIGIAILRFLIGLLSGMVGAAITYCFLIYLNDLFDGKVKEVTVELIKSYIPELKQQLINALKVIVISAILIFPGIIVAFLISILLSGHIRFIGILAGFAIGLIWLIGMMPLLFSYQFELVIGKRKMLEALKHSFKLGLRNYLLILGYLASLVMLGVVILALSFVVIIVSLCLLAPVVYLFFIVAGSLAHGISLALWRQIREKPSA